MTLLPSAGFPFRVNVSFLIEQPLLDLVRSMNTIIRNFGGEFLFEPLGRPIPHITLLMGNVKSAAHLSEIDTRARALAKIAWPIEFEVGEPYYRDRAKRYIFVDVVPQSTFLQLRVQIQKELSKLLELDHYGDAKNVSHITLGFIENGGPPDLIDKLSTALVGTRVAVAHRLQLAETGARGTCVNTLSVHDLAEREG